LFVLKKDRFFQVGRFIAQQSASLSPSSAPPLADRRRSRRPATRSRIKWTKERP